MITVNKKQLLYIFLLAIIGLICLADVLFGFLSSVAIAVGISIIMIIVSYMCVLTDNSRYKMSYYVAFGLYTVLTQFGLVICYVLFGENVVSGYKEWTLYFLHGQYIPYLVKSISLANVAIISYTFWGIIGSQKANKKSSNLTGQEASSFNLIPGKHRNGVAALIMLLIVLGYLLLMILTNRFSLSLTYFEVKNGDLIHTTLFRYILILYSCATIYMVFSDSNNKKINYSIWIVIAFMLLVTGNRGEVLYPLLSAVGAIAIRDGRIKVGYIVGALLTLFIVIPSIAALRSVGILGNISQFRFDPTAGLTEIGMQIRTSVYTMANLDSGELHFLFGKSYYQPIINIISSILFFLRIPHEVVRSLLPISGAGYSQVIESYINFGALGTIVFFAVCGYSLAFYEKKFANDSTRLCLLGCITSILINATRNYFAFVPGQIIIVFAVFIIINKVKWKWKK